MGGEDQPGDQTDLRLSCQACPEAIDQGCIGRVQYQVDQVVGRGRVIACDQPEQLPDHER